MPPIMQVAYNNFSRQHFEWERNMFDDQYSHMPKARIWRFNVDVLVNW